MKFLLVLFSVGHSYWDVCESEAWLWTWTPLNLPASGSEGFNILWAPAQLSREIPAAEI